MQKVYDGFEKACKEIGAEPLYKGPEAATPEKQIEIINQLVAQNVAGIAIAANDADALQPALTEAMDADAAIIMLFVVLLIDFSFLSKLQVRLLIR